MKKHSIILTLVLAVLVGLTGCKKEEYVLDPAPSKLEGINGTFSLAKVMQVDQLTFDVNNSLDVSSVFVGETPARITFDSDAGTFSYDSGSTIDFIGGSGSWSFDNNDYPTKIMMNNGADTYEVTLLRTIRPQDNLEFQLDRMCSGTLVFSYQYFFERI